MKRQLRNFRVHALTLMIVATALGCTTNGSRPLPEVGAQQTLAMVLAGRFAELDRDYAAIQAAYDNGSISDERLRAAFRHFYDSSPDLAPRYEAWVQGMPDSYVAHLARAIYYLRVGEESRGNLIIADTSDTQLNGMEAAFAAASGELKKSLSLEKKPLLSVFYLLDIGKFQGDAAGNRQLLDASVAMDPKNFIVREMYLMTLQTAWGGSTEQMKAFVAESATVGLSAARMKDMQSMVFADEAWVDESAHNYKRAATEYLEAAKLSGDEVCLLCAGKALARAADFPDAARVLTEYLAQDPESAEAFAFRADAYRSLGRTADAVSDYKRAAELGDALSQYTLATLYLLGEYGVPQDRDAGIQWLTRAAAGGDQDAKKLLPIALNKQIRLLPGATWGSKQKGQ